MLVAHASRAATEIVSNFICRLSKRSKTVMMEATKPWTKAQGPHLGLHPAALQATAFQTASQQLKRPLRRPQSRGSKQRRGLQGRVGYRVPASEAILQKQRAEQQVILPFTNVLHLLLNNQESLKI